jgi:hypothetical protein
MPRRTEDPSRNKFHPSLLFLAFFASFPRS